VSASPRVSIGLPVYNGERYLARTLADWRRQTFGDFELIVCDNASTDATADIARAAADADPRVRYVRNDTNLGALGNANKAFSLSAAPLYVLSAYDDRHAPDFLAALVGALDEDSDAVLAYGDATLIDEHERPLRFDPVRRSFTGADGIRHDYDARLQQPMSPDRLARFRAVLRSNDVNAPIHGLFRRDALDRIGPHQLHGSDRLIVAHAALLGRFAFVPLPLFGFRIHAASTLHLTREQWLEREAGESDAGSPLDGFRTLTAYLDATGRAHLGPFERVRAVGATLGYALRPHVLRNIFVPGPDNYWGWTRWPWKEDADRSIRGNEARDDAIPTEWRWLYRDP
jgi:glycosyltransferase involved in cell wall biosynthesis